MSRKGKLEKFAQLNTFANVYQNFDYPEVALKGQHDTKIKYYGNWAENAFQNQQPIILELACGGGEYAISLAKKFPEINLIGIDVKGNRIWKGAKIGLQEHIRNLVFIRIRIEQLEQVFAPGEIHQIWITFPDPFVKKSKANRRLTSPNFLKIYKNLLAPGGLVHLKTDAKSLFDYTLATLAEARISPLETVKDIYGQKEIPEILKIQTKYEKRHLEEGKIIYYLNFRFQAD